MKEAKSHLVRTTGLKPPSPKAQQMPRELPGCQHIRTVQSKNPNFSSCQHCHEDRWTSSLIAEDSSENPRTNPALSYPELLQKHPALPPLSLQPSPSPYGPLEEPMGLHQEVATGTSSLTRALPLISTRVQLLCLGNISGTMSSLFF